MLRTNIATKPELVVKPDWQEGQIFAVKVMDEKDVTYGKVTEENKATLIRTLPRGYHIDLGRSIPKRAELITDQEKLSVVKNLFVAAEQFHQLKVP